MNHALHQRHEVVSALLIQCQKMILQMTLDRGSWDSARLLWPETDPYETMEFGGSEVEMHRIHQYRKALADLKTKTKANPEDPKRHNPEEGGEGDEKKSGRRKGKGRGRGGDGT